MLTMPSRPIVRELSINAATEAVFALFAAEPYSVFLDSANDAQGMGHYSYLAHDPFLTFSCKGRQVKLTEGDKVRQLEADPFTILQELMQQYQTEQNNEFPFFTGGAIGYFAYDLGYLLEVIPGKSQDDLSLPDCCLGFYDTVLIYDHYTGKYFAAANGFPAQEEKERQRRAKERLAALAELVAQANDEILPLPKPQEPEGAYVVQFTQPAYEAAVQKCIDYIAAGDIFEVNLSQRFAAPLTAEPYEIYRYLRQINPAPFAAYLNFGQMQVASASPERYMLLKEREVETRPIKGTRPRGKDEAADHKLREELWHSEKDRAELVMIIDLERNDLGRVCEYGSVKVPDLIRLEEYATVFHLVSTVVGKLLPGKDIIDLIKASFPGGSITGAPKVRSMEIIDELEPCRRSVYTGSIGYLDFNGNADLNIVIRTMLLKGEKAYFQVGGAIVADSIPQAEYEETLDKGRALFRALGYQV